MNIELIKSVVVITVIVCCIGAGVFIFFRYKKAGSGILGLRYAVVPWVAGIMTLLSTMVLSTTKKDSYIVTSEDYVVIDLNESNQADFGILLGDSPIKNYLDGFNFSYLDLDRNELDEAPIKVTEVKADKKNGWYTVTVSAQIEGVYFIRCSHKLADFSTDIMVVVTRNEPKK